MLTVNRLNKWYGSRQILFDVSMQLQPGMVQGIVGENGSGKTTLFECLKNLTPYEGTIDVGSRLKIGYHPTSLYFYPLMKGMEYIEFCMAAQRLKLDTQRVDELNQLFDLPLGQYATEYSTGMKIKLSLLALLLQGNDLLLLDEPFNGLDLGTFVILKQVILGLKKQGKSILLSSHIIASLTEVCDNIAYLHQGSILKTYHQPAFAHIEQDIMQHSLHATVELIERMKF